MNPGFAGTRLTFCNIEQMFDRTSLLNRLSLGVTHLVVADDFGGISAIVQWLSYVPKVRNLIVQSFGHVFSLQYLDFSSNVVALFYFLMPPRT